MSTTANPAPMSDSDGLQDAEKIIERFGGIRPMATKMDVPVTTVQGWKMRNIIPANRKDDVLSAARLHNVDVSDLVPGGDAFAVSLDRASRVQAADPAARKPHEDALVAARATEAMEARKGTAVTYDEMMREVARVRAQSVRRSVTAAIVVVALFAMLAGTLAMVVRKQDQARIAALESTVQDIDDLPSQGVLEGTMTEMSRKFQDLRARTEKLQDNVVALKRQAEVMLDPENSSVFDRLVVLEEKFQTLVGGNADLALVLKRLQDMQGTMQGQEQMQAAVTDLQKLVGGLQGKIEGMDTALAEEQQSDSALGQALEGVSPQELKAAAMLIGLSQFRESLNRSGPFAADLALLQKILGDKDPALAAEIERLAPYAEKGVLSPRGLSNELKALAGDIAVSSLSGEDLSIQDKAMARFQDMVKVNKDGQPVMGSEAQATVARAQQMLDAGNVDGAVMELQSLQGPARQTAQPLIDQAQITAMAQQVQTMMTNAVMARIKTGGGSAPLTATPTLIDLTPAPVPAP